VIEQAAIAVFGTATVFLSQDHRPERRKLACLFGLASQPFWLFASITAQQWGIALLTVLYFLGWARGFYTFWIKGRPA
jgi:hypothetical protein